MFSKASLYAHLEVEAVAHPRQNPKGGFIVPIRGLQQTQSHEVHALEMGKKLTGLSISGTPKFEKKGEKGENPPPYVARTSLLRLEEQNRTNKKKEKEGIAETNITTFNKKCAEQPLHIRAKLKAVARRRRRTPPSLYIRRTPHSINKIEGEHTWG